MAEKAKKKGPSRGATRMREQGYKLVAVWLDQHEYAVVVAAANRSKEKMATFVRRAAFHAAVDDAGRRIRRERE